MLWPGPAIAAHSASRIMNGTAPAPITATWSQPCQEQPRQQLPCPEHCGESQTALGCIGEARGCPGGSWSISPPPRPEAHRGGRNFTSSSWKSTFSSFLHLVFRTRAERLLAVSPLSSAILFRFTLFLDLSPAEASPERRPRTLGKPWTLVRGRSSQAIHFRSCQDNERLGGGRP